MSKAKFFKLTDLNMDEYTINRLSMHQFWTETRKNYPIAFEQFNMWLAHYSQKNGLNNVFEPMIDFPSLPVAMQAGVFCEFANDGTVHSFFVALHEHGLKEQIGQIFLYMEDKHVKQFPELKTGLMLVRDEVLEQIHLHRYTDEFIDQNPHFYESGELADAAQFALTFEGWPPNWDADAREKIRNKPFTQRVTVAAALLAREAGRLHRIEQLRLIKSVQEDLA